MLHQASEKEIQQNLSFVYSLALDQSCSGYPVYTDGLKTREDFVQSVWRSFQDKNSEVLLYEVEGRVEGWIQFFFLPEDRYLQTDGFFIARHTRAALAEFLDYAGTRFSGYELYLGFPGSNTEAVSFLRERGWACVEDLCHDVLFFDRYPLAREPGDVVPVTRENFPAFRQIHDDSIYWNSDRLYKRLDDWRIYLYNRDGSPAGALFLTGGEIFGLDYREGNFDREAYDALMTRALNDCKRQGMEHIVCFHEPESQSAALEMGFSCVGEYLLFVKAI